MEKHELSSSRFVDFAIRFVLTSPITTGGKYATSPKSGTIKYIAAERSLRELTHRTFVTLVGLLQEQNKLVSLRLYALPWS